MIVTAHVPTSANLGLTLNQYRAYEAYCEAKFNVVGISSEKWCASNNTLIQKRLPHQEMVSL